MTIDSLVFRTAGEALRPGVIPPMDAMQVQLRGGSNMTPSTPLLERRWCAIYRLGLAIVLGIVLAPPAVGQESRVTGSAEMAHRVDQLLEQRLDALGWTVAPPAADTAFLRRAYLDLTGTPPSGRQVLDFLADKSPDKRDSMIAVLLDSPASAAHLGATWADWLLPEDAAANPLLPRNVGLQNWLRDRFAENLRYDRLVADLLVSTGSVQNGPTSFFVALEGSPKKIAAKTARVFMGVQLDCAECHDHPFDDWTQQDFWGYAAYFARVSTDSTPGMQPRGEVTDAAEGEVTLPDTEEVIAPKPLVKSGVSSLSLGTRRQQLTLWLTTRENPFLARATVNRVWALLFGQGLIEPIDDMRSLDIASHPELLSELSDYFSETGYDLRNLLATLARTRAYRRASLHSDGEPPQASYATMISKPMTQRQLAGSLIQVSRQVGAENTQAQSAALERQLGQLRGEASEAKLGIVNALVTLNGRDVDRFSRESSSRLLKALEAPFMNQEKQIRWLFLSTLCRPPTADELTKIGQLIETMAAEQNYRPPSTASTDSETETDTVASADEPDSSKEPVSDDNSVSQEAAFAKQWQSDILWALLNSSEFAMTP